MRIRGIALAFLVVVVSLPGLVWGQEPLGDFARQQRELRSKEAKKPVKVFTNDNLPARPPQEGVTAASGISKTPAEGPSSTASSAPPQPESKPEAKTESPEDRIKTKDYWQSKFTALRDQLAAAKEQQQLVEDELNLLQIQQVRELDPNARNQLTAKVEAKQAEVDTKRAATTKAQKALDDLDKEFKASGAPEDWSKTEEAP